MSTHRLSRATRLASRAAAADIGRIATEAGVRHLALNHFVPKCLPGFGDDAWTEAVCATRDGPLPLGRDGLRIDLWRNSRNIRVAEGGALA